MSVFDPKTQVSVLLRDRFDFVEFLGKGGFAAVYKVRSLSLGRLEALKVLIETHSDDPDFARRFQQEARVAASLDHPNIIRIYEFGQVQGHFWYSMQLVDGPTLTSELKAKGPLDEQTAARLAVPLLDALDYSHGQGVIHRDIKPDNLILDSRRHPYVMDFGIAKSSDSVVQTRSGFILGSPAYLSPEQLRGEPLDGRTDVYSFGITLYQMLSGLRPFEAEDRTQLLLKRLKEDPIPLSQSRPGVSSELETIVMRSLARERENRFFSAAEMRDALELFLADLSATSVNASRPGSHGGKWERPLPIETTALLSTTAETGPLVPPPLSPEIQNPPEPRVAPPPLSLPPKVLPPRLDPVTRRASPLPLIVLGAGLVVLASGAFLWIRDRRFVPPPPPSVNQPTPTARAISSLPDIPKAVLGPEATTLVATPSPTAVVIIPVEKKTDDRAAHEFAKRSGVPPQRSPRERAEALPPASPRSTPAPHRVRKFFPEVESAESVKLRPELAKEYADTDRRTGIEVKLADDGTIVSAKVKYPVSPPCTECDTAALESVKRSRFRPARDTEGLPMETTFLVSVPF